MSLLAVVLAFTLVLVTAWTNAAAARLEARRLADRESMLTRARGPLLDWYRGHLAEIDGPGWTRPDPTEALQDLGFTAPIKVGLSAPQREGNVSGRILLAWSSDPQELARESFDIANGALRTPAGATRMVRIDGRTVERAALRQAQQQLQGLAGALETWFRARVADDPLHRMDRNYFRPLDPGCHVEPDELPCLPDYARADQLSFWHAALDLASADLQTPWGASYPIEVSNGADASASPPYSLALRVRTPWGGLIEARAVEPGN
jgi:hypothetical protein